MMDHVVKAVLLTVGFPFTLLGTLLKMLIYGPGVKTKRPTLQLHGRCPVCKRKLWCKV
jgi:hypothetical protein